MRKKYILDTSSLIHDPCVYKQFDHCDVIIPIAVLNELDKLKKSSNEVGKNARVSIRMIDEISLLGDISTGVMLDNDIYLSVDASWYNTALPAFDGFGDPNYGDTQILACAYTHWYNHPEKDVVLVSSDINLRIKAKSRGIGAESRLDSKTTSLSDLYPGMQVIVDEDAGLDLQAMGSIDPTIYGFNLYANECVAFEDFDNNVIAMARKISDTELRLIKKAYPWNLSARNKEQSFAIDLIMDKKIDLITLIGRAGTGKSLVALATALELVISKKEYDKLIIYRPIQSVGNDIGYLPGPQPLDAKILTPNGWSTMGEIQPNDSIIGSDGLPKKVIKIFPKGNKEVFKVIFSDGSSTECCEDHLWFTTTRLEENKTGSVKSLKEIRNTLKAYKTKVNNHKIQMIKPVSFAEKNTVIDPYIMGVLLGDGTLLEKYSVYFTSSDEQIFDNCKECLPENMICKVKSKTKNSYNYSIIMKTNIDRKHRNENIFAKEIVKLGLLGSKSGTKFIPNDYKINSINNRLSILQGLMDTDGFVSKDGADVSYSTTSDQLAEDVKFLVQSLGGYASINKKISTYTYNNVERELLSNVVSVSLPDNMCPFRIDRKIERFKSRKYPLTRMISDVYSVGIKETKCILVESDDHLYATDDFILTHNTMEEKLGPWFQAIMDNFESLLSTKGRTDWKRTLELYQKNGVIEMEAITYIRGRSIGKAIILVDECQNLSKEEVKTILTRAGEGTKIILTGDIEQIDNSSLDATSNGLTHAIEKFKELNIAGHITFTHGERSRLASKAAEIL